MHPTPSNPVNLSAKSMFIFEYKTRLVSGFVHWADPVRIRHVASGRYLYVNSTPAQDAEAQHKGLLYETLLVNDNEVVDIKRR